MMSPLTRSPARSAVTAYLANVLYERGRYEEAERQAVLSEKLAGMDDDYATLTHARSARRALSSEIPTASPKARLPPGRPPAYDLSGSPVPAQW